MSISGRYLRALLVTFFGMLWPEVDVINSQKSTSSIVLEATYLRRISWRYSRKWIEGRFK